MKDDRTKKKTVRAQAPAGEMALAALIVAAGVWSTTLSPYYLSLDQIFGSTRFFIIPGLLALGLAMVVSLGEIDISLATTIAVGTVALSKLSILGVPIGFAAAAVIVSGRSLEL